MTNQIDLQTIKDWFTLMVAIIVTIAGVIFWVQSINDPKFENLVHRHLDGMHILYFFLHL